MGQREVISNPKSAMQFGASDVVGLIGDTQELEQTRKLLLPEHASAPMPSNETFETFETLTPSR